MISLVFHQHPCGPGLMSAPDIHGKTPDFPCYGGWGWFSEENGGGGPDKGGSNGEEHGGWIQVQIYKTKQGGGLW